MYIGITKGKIADIQYVNNSFEIKFESDDGVFDNIHLSDVDRQLATISSFFELETSAFPSQLVGKRVNLIFGPILFSDSNAAMLYGFGKEEEDIFIIPHYLFAIAKKEMKKDFFNSSEVIEFLECVESIL